MTEKMLVAERMIKHSEVIDPGADLATAQGKMRQGNFQSARRFPAAGVYTFSFQFISLASLIRPVLPLPLSAQCPRRRIAGGNAVR